MVFAATCANSPLRKRHYKTEICIDAAVAKLRDEKSEALKRNHFLEIIGTSDYPIDSVISLMKSNVLRENGVRASVSLDTLR